MNVNLVPTVYHNNDSTGELLALNEVFRLHAVDNVISTLWHARAWFTRASKHRSSVWKVTDKRPGYNASDSDSDDLNDNDAL
ncbi:hypothetical protein FRX31_022970 [Thalictrum thalictroides]|uniref:Uncharacterized protein n=1 Tax=Thalictrum thalictroides TaxID=46969 RepID=A0A7J6VSW3_THATH|nr:hypothetical protein FRX31_022970 [Thalictrum thalictroides]